MIRFELSDEVRMSIREKELTRRLNGLRNRLEVITKQQRCDLLKAIDIFKDLHVNAGKKLSEETLMDLELIAREVKTAGIA